MGDPLPMTPSPMTPSNGPADEVIAEMRWMVSTKPPSVTLAFEGLRPPLQVLAELSALGWSVPSPPSPPSTAIEWVPDSVTGAAHTVRPWRVTGFELSHGDWTPEVASSIGTRTHDVLRRSGVEVRGNSESLKALEANWQPKANTQVTPQLSQQAVGEQSVLGGFPHVVVIGYKGEPVPDLIHLDGLTGGRSKQRVLWSESHLDLSDLCPTEALRAQLLGDSAQSWVLNSIESSPTNLKGTVPFCALIPGVDLGNKKVKKLVSALEGSLGVGVATSLDTRSKNAGLLIAGSVASNHFELISSNLRMRFPEAVVRLQPS